MTCMDRGLEHNIADLVEVGIDEMVAFDGVVVTESSEPLGHSVSSEVLPVVGSVYGIFVPHQLPLLHTCETTSAQTAARVDPRSGWSLSMGS